jgi:hypothetical protein
MSDQRFPTSQAAPLVTNLPRTLGTLKTAPLWNKQWTWASPLLIMPMCTDWIGAERISVSAKKHSAKFFHKHQDYEIRLFSPQKVELFLASRMTRHPLTSLRRVKHLYDG